MSMQNTDKLIKKLKGIIFSLQYSTAGYLLASKYVEDPAIKESLLIYSRERSFYQLQLQHEIDKLGKDYTEDWEDELRQKTWDGIRNDFCLHSFLATCIKTEEKLIHKYKVSLQKITFYSTLSLLLQNQLSGIEKSLIQIKYQHSLDQS